MSRLPGDGGIPVAYAYGTETRETVEAAAEALGLTVFYEAPAADDGAPFLRLSQDGLSLSDGQLSMKGDFSRMTARIKPGNLNGELLVRAAKIKSLGAFPTAVDATAGLGEDSFLLAAAGFSVTMFERNPVIALLLRDALRRAAENGETAQAAQRMRVLAQDSIAALPLYAPPPDLILLDPMFPARRKSALVKKKFQLLHLLEEPCTDETALLSAALSAHPKKIIVKRPAKGPFLAGRKPDYSVQGNGIRYDCIVP